MPMPLGLCIAGIMTFTNLVLGAPLVLCTGDFPLALAPTVRTNSDLIYCTLVPPAQTASDRLNSGLTPAGRFIRFYWAAGAQHQGI